MKKSNYYSEEDYGYEEDTLFCVIEEPLVDQALLSTQNYLMEWILDSGYTNHMIKRKDIFSTLDSSY